MNTVVISQPMFLPWLGMFEQIRLADVYVHYDDVQLSKGSMVTRIQIRTGIETSWLSLPRARRESGPLISQTNLVHDKTWRSKHLDTLRHTYSNCPFGGEAVALAEEIYAIESDSLAEFNMQGIEILSTAIGLNTKFERSSRLGISGQSTDRVVSICKHFQASLYITGHGARNYIAHEDFEAQQISIEYMRYDLKPWPQRYEPFTPYVTALDAIAAVGVKEVHNLLRSGTTPWRDFEASAMHD